MALSQQIVGRWTPRALGVLRIVTSFLYLQHGTAKVFHVPHVPMFDKVGLFTLDGCAGLLELIASPLLLVGLFTRPVAFLLSGEMALAYFMVHAQQGHVLAPSLNGGEVAVLYCFIFLFMAAAGGGSWSIDALLRGRQSGGELRKPLENSPEAGTLMSFFRP